MRRFTAFCELYEVQDPFLVTGNLPYSFAAFLGDQGLAPQTIKSYLAANRNTQLSPWPSQPQRSLHTARTEEGTSRGWANSDSWQPPCNFAPSSNCLVTQGYARGVGAYSQPGAMCVMGGLLYGLFQLFSPGRAASDEAFRLQPTTPPDLGGHGGRQ